MNVELSNTMTFSDEQSMLLDTATEFCKAQSPIAQVRDSLLREHGYSDALWTELVGLGWTGIAIDEAFGGSGLGVSALVPVVEPMGRHLMATPFVASQIAAQGLIAGGSDEQQARWLPRLAEGARASVALTEPDGDWGMEVADVTFDKGVLNGVKSLVLDALTAQVLLVSCRIDDQPAVAIVETSSIPADQISREQVLDETRRSYRVDVSNVEVAAQDLITGDAAVEALNAMERVAWLLLSADACGGIHSTIELVVDYLNTRTQFGRKIGSYQALKHPTVDMLTGLERARSHVYHAASLFTAAAPVDALEIALRMAKADACEAYVFAADRAVQFHGGFGFTYDCDAQLYLRRALWLQHQYGDAPHHRQALQALLLG